MTSIRKSIAAAALGLALAGALGFGASELYASAAADGQDCPSVCPVEEKASSTCPVEKAEAACPVEEAAACPNSAKGA
ncbi:MAG: hypothetical protein HN712_27535 [Gemmatimonadetes bacterium]|jgi:hypothetical protein|nr:hypothetical protein [Gemmatimonadota bacterium]MBT6144696.1 hypothetical protein [Gemmatimonadota bacterium]MBT7864094.1 hypothetical protein [Gemmatimonadota bacterium]